MSKHYGKVNKKIVALIVEILLFIISGIIVLILDSINKQINIFIWVAIYSVLIFTLLLTLSLIRYERLRDIRANFKDTNLPLYTDNTTLIGHDIKDETEEDHE